MSDLDPSDTGGNLAPPPQAGAYGAIYADPPWQTLTWSAAGRDRCLDGPRLNSYTTAPTTELAALPVASWGARDCRLFMWAIDSHLPQALELGAAWGFAYSTVAFTWAKRTCTGSTWMFGAGHVTRKGTELCLLFLRGKLHRRSAAVRQLVVAPVTRGRSGHSKKPDEVYGRIEALVDGPYLELFARQRRPGMGRVGDQLEPAEPLAPGN